MSEGAARFTLQPVNAGMARLSALFSVDVRNRAEPYLRSERIVILEDRADVLLAEVEGTSKYRIAFKRFDRTMYYGCTCPFFTEGLIGCKHQWALVRRAAKGALVLRAVECDRFAPSAACVFGLPEELAEPVTPEPPDSLGAQLAQSILLARRASPR